MGERFPPARWTLPTVVDPPTSICFAVPVPNDKFHIAAFMGAIHALTWSKNWQRDTAHTAKDVAAVWQAIFDNMERCMEPVQFRTVVACVLEFSTDGGATWAVAFDASQCVNEVIIERIEDGTISGGGQPPGAGDGTPGQCYTYHVTLNAGARWRAPVAIDAGDVITVSQVEGAWYDGDVSRLGRWDCADGQAFALGTCQPGLTYDAGDPLPGSPHMMIIGGLPDETTPFVELYNTNYTVVAGPQNLDIQANDGNLDDNAGSVTFEVEICKGLWCVEYDFTAGDQGWFNAAHAGEGGCQGSYHSTIGWVADCQPGGTFQRISIGYLIDLAGATATSAEIDITTAAGASSSSLYVKIFGVVVRDLSGAGALASGDSTLTIGSLALTGDDVQWVTIDSNAGSPVTIEKIRFRGTGTRPPGEPAC